MHYADMRREECLDVGHEARTLLGLPRNLRPDDGSFLFEGLEPSDEAEGDARRGVLATRLPR